MVSLRHHLTLVCAACVFISVFKTAASAAVSPVSPEDSLDNATAQSAPPTEAETARASQVQITRPKSEAQQTPKAESANGYYFPFHKSISLRGGLENTFNNSAQSGALFSVLYWFPRRDLRGVEVGADLEATGGELGTGILHIASRNVVGKGRWRGFHKFGGGVRVVPSEQLVTFLRLKNWQVRLSGGVECSVADPYTIRIDLDGTLSTERMSAVLTLGFGWNW